MLYHSQDAGHCTRCSLNACRLDDYRHVRGSEDSPGLGRLPERVRSLTDHLQCLDRPVLFSASLLSPKRGTHLNMFFQAGPLCSSQTLLKTSSHLQQRLLSFLGAAPPLVSVEAPGQPVSSDCRTGSARCRNLSHSLFSVVPASVRTSLPSG